MKQVKLTQTEINHILNLIESNKEEGFYYGNKDQYWKRSSNIENKLMTLVRHNYILSVKTMHNK
jgi:hypothetical protein